MDVSDIFYFFCSGAGEREEESEEVAGGTGVSLKSRGRGGVSQEKARGGGRAPGECLWGWGGA